MLGREPYPSREPKLSVPAKASPSPRAGLFRASHHGVVEKPGAEPLGANQHDDGK